MADHEEAGGGVTAWVHGLTKRNLLIVAVLFLSNIVTAVSTLATAWGVLRQSTADWRPAEYRKLRALRGGHALERFTQTLGPASYRFAFRDHAPGVEVPGMDKARLTMHVFRPREDYRVEVITEPGNSTLVYAVTSCRPDFRPSFEVDRNNRRSAEYRFTITLGTPLADVRPEISTVRQWMTATGARQAAVSQQVGTGEEDGRREYAWGANDVCPLTSAEERARSVTFWSAWEAWQRGRTPDEHGVYEGRRSDPQTRSLMKRSTVNVYAETMPYGQISAYYPALLGVDRHHAD
ncbi:hypothetical protein [Streptomyces sp. NPDC051214]|uniref:hypothetical protein n=1 Tax=Streptomyces sp. NPDC051214 TaxID=3155282 RepID=UPI00344952AA